MTTPIKGMELAARRFTGAGFDPTPLEERAAHIIFNDLSCTAKRQLLDAFERGKLADEKLILLVLDHYNDCHRCQVLYATPHITRTTFRSSEERVATHLAGILYNLYMIDDRQGEVMAILKAWLNPGPTTIPFLQTIIAETAEFTGLDDDFTEMGSYLGKNTNHIACQEAARQAIKRVVSSFPREHREKLLL